MFPASARWLSLLDLFWHLGNPHLGVHVVEGIIKGDGPWKIGDAVVRVLGCHGTDGALARRFDEWRTSSPRIPTHRTCECRGNRMSEAADSYPPRTEIEAIARRHGALV